MQLDGGPPGWVPTVSVRGVRRPSASTFTELHGSTSAVVYLSSAGPFAEASFLGKAIAPSTPTGLHWLLSAPAGAGGARLQVSRVGASRANNFPALTLIPARYRGQNTAARWSDGASTLRRTSSVSMTSAISSAQPLHAARAPSGSRRRMAAVSSS